MNVKKRLFAIALAAATIALTACGGGTNGEDKSSQNSTSAQGEGTSYREMITFGAQKITKIFDPTGSNQADDGNSMYYTHQRLLSIDQDGEITGDLAERYEYDPDSLTYTFYLKPNAVFSNGDPVTADDVVYTLMRAKESSYSADRMSAIKGAEALDTNTVQVYLEQPNLDVLSSLAHAQTSILSKAAMEADPDNGYFIGSGPYTIADLEPDNYVLYQRVEDYYDGTAKTKYLKYIKIAEASSRAMALQSGDIDIDTYLSKAEAVIMDGSDGFEILEVPATNSFFLQLNAGAPRCPQLADERVRQAISYVVNQEEIIAAGQDGYGYVNGLFPKVSLDTSAYGPTFHEPDLEKAKQLMAEAGCADGFELDISYLEKYTAAVEVLQAQLAQINIELTVHTTDTTLRTTEQKDSTFSANLLTFNNNYAPGTMATKLLRSTGAAHYTQVSDPEIDELCDQVFSETDLEKRQVLGAQLEKAIAEQACYIPLCGMIDLYGVNDQVQGLYFNNNVLIMTDAYIVE